MARYKNNPLSNLIKGVKNFFTGSTTGKGRKEDRKMATNWFTDEINKSKYKERISRVNEIDDYLRREHKVLTRPDFEWKEETFTTAKIILQTLKSVLKFHVSYICGNPVSITGDKDLVARMNKIYKKGNYSKTDMQVTKDLITYGDAFEYVYIGDDEKIKSKVIRNKDSYPITDSDGRYTQFVEHWKDIDTKVEHDIVYYPDKVEIWESGKLLETKNNLTGLPIWYTSLDKARLDKFGDPMMLDLIPIMDSIEQLMSKIDDAVKTLALNPLGVVTGQRIDNGVNNNVVGVVLNLEDGSDFKYATVDMDRDTIKMELDYLIQQFYAVACVPASIMGQSNVANVSETSITMLYQQTDNIARQYIVSLVEGMAKRFEYIKKLLELQSISIDEDTFDTLAIEFNVNRPVDRKSDMENMKMQYECGALSRQTMIDKSPYTTDTALEMQRLEAEKLSPKLEDTITDTENEPVSEEGLENEQGVENEDSNGRN